MMRAVSSWRAEGKPNSAGVSLTTLAWHLLARRGVARCRAGVGGCRYRSHMPWRQRGFQMSKVQLGAGCARHALAAASRAFDCYAASDVRRVAFAALVLALTAGCGTHSSPAAIQAGAPTSGTPCGMTRTAANVPVNIQVARGQGSCATALTVARAYARAVSAGQSPGKGGGRPALFKCKHVQGICQYDRHYIRTETHI